MQTPLLLCELHAHTTWSDGALTLTELVDLYGRERFDVLCITDHALPDRRRPTRPLRLDRHTHAHYLRAIEREARRARDQYGLLVIPGLPWSPRIRTDESLIESPSGPRVGSGGTATGSTGWWIASSSSIGSKRSAGSPRRAYRASRPETFIASST
jgi:hypothetical protein